MPEAHHRRPVSDEALMARDRHLKEYLSPQEYLDMQIGEWVRIHGEIPAISLIADEGAGQQEVDETEPDEEEPEFAESHPGPWCMTPMFWRETERVKPHAQAVLTPEEYKIFSTTHRQDLFDRVYGTPEATSNVDGIGEGFPTPRITGESQ